MKVKLNNDSKNALKILYGYFHEVFHRKLAIGFEERIDFHRRKFPFYGERELYKYLYTNEEEVNLVLLEQFFLYTEDLLLETDSKSLKEFESVFKDLKGFFYINEISTIPIYDDVLILSCFSHIIDPIKIPLILNFFQIPGTKTMVERENHNFGYHFHYGIVKSGKINRTNLLLTFDPQQPEDKKGILYWEYHGDGHSKIIDVALMYENKRLPIFLVCHDNGKSIGFSNFKKLSNKSKEFYKLIDKSPN